YWAEKADTFAKTAEEVLASHKQSGAAVKYIADYVYWGLGRGKRAIEILYDGYNQKLLDEGGQAQLADYLQRENRHGEAIALLLPLIEGRPENLDYRVRLLRAYYYTGRQDDLHAQLKQTDAFFHEKERWTENVMATLGHVCLETRLFEQSVAYYKEAIPLHQRTHTHRGIGHGTLSHYYTQLAQAHAG